MRQYATLFDSNYLPKGLALYESLKRHSSEPFKLYVLPLDQATHETLRNLNLLNVELVDRDDFERTMRWQPHGEGLKENRTHAEYCWTCASNLVEQLLLLKRLPEMTYLDADLFFFSDPSPVFKEIGKRSIAITPHQFPDNKEKPRLLKSGFFNVGFVSFKRTPKGMRCLLQWAAQVRKRCSAEVGCGDQVYLDSWPQEFGEEVAVLGIGVNMGPWNLSAHDVSLRGGKVYLGEHPLVCYHAHEYVHGQRLTNYPLRPQDIELVYAPYVDAINRAQERIANLTLTSQ